MQIRRLELQNVCQHAHTVCEFPLGVIGILGPNGSGKSNLLNMLEAALTGSFSANAGVKEDNVHWFAGERDVSRIVVDLEHAGHEIRVIRGLQRASTQLVIDGGEPIRGDTKVTEELGRLWGLTPAILSQYVFVKQGKLFEFIDQTEGQRAKVFQRLFRTERAEALAKEVNNRQVQAQVQAPHWVDEETLKAQQRAHREAYAALERQLAGYKIEDDEPTAATYRAAQQEQVRLHGLRIRRTTVNAQIHEIEDKRTTAQNRLSTVTGELAQLRTALAESKEDAEQAKAALRLWAVVEQRRTRRQQFDRKVAALQAEYDARPAPCVAEVAQQAQAVLDQDADLRAPLQSQMQTAARFLAQFEAGTATECPTCFTPVTTLADKITEFRRIYDESHEKLLQLDTARREAKQTVQAWNEWQHWYASYKANKQALADEEAAMQAETVTAPTADSAQLQELIAAHTQIETTLGALTVEEGRLREELVQQSGQLARLHVELGTLNDELSKAAKTQQIDYAAWLEAFEARKLAAAETSGRLAELRETLQRNAALVADNAEAKRRGEQQGRWRDHLRAMHAVLQTAPRLLSQRWLEIIEVQINGLLAYLGVEFRVKVGEDLSFAAHFEDGRVQAAGRLSYGQKTVLALCFRVVVNSRFTQDLGLLTLDEPTASLDQKNLGCLETAIAQLRTLSASRGLQCIIVTHEERLAHLFDAVVQLSGAVRPQQVLDDQQESVAVGG